MYAINKNTIEKKYLKFELSCMANDHIGWLTLKSYASISEGTKMRSFYWVIQYIINESDLDVGQRLADLSG